MCQTQSTSRICTILWVIFASALFPSISWKPEARRCNPFLHTKGTSEPARILVQIRLVDSYDLHTPEQFSKATKVIANGRKAFYIVESLSVPGQEYRVEWNDEHHCLQCLPHTGEACPASKNGLQCWHKRAALAAEEHYRQEQAERRQSEQAEAESDPMYEIEQAFRDLEDSLDAVDRIFEAMDKRDAQYEARLQALA